MEKSKSNQMEEIKERPAPPQLSRDLFQEITRNTLLYKGQFVYEMLDQTKSHWQFKRYRILMMTSKGLMVTDETKNILKNPFTLQIYRGHA